MSSNPAKSIVHAPRHVRERFKLELKRAAKTTNERGCHIWQGEVVKKGYGAFRWFDPKTHVSRGFPAHKASLELKLGRPLEEGKYACHRCPGTGGGVPPDRRCVNDNHLSEDTQSENMMDVYHGLRDAQNDT